MSFADPFSMVTRRRSRLRGLGDVGEPWGTSDPNAGAMDLLGVQPSKSSVQGPPPTRKTDAPTSWTGPDYHDQITSVGNTPPPASSTGSGGGIVKVGAAALVLAKLFKFF